MGGPLFFALFWAKTRIWVGFQKFTSDKLLKGFHPMEVALRPWPIRASTSWETTCCGGKGGILEFRGFPSSRILDSAQVVHEPVFKPGWIQGWIPLHGPEVCTPGINQVEIWFVHCVSYEKGLEPGLYTGWPQQARCTNRFTNRFVHRVIHQDRDITHASGCKPD